MPRPSPRRAVLTLLRALAVVYVVVLSFPAPASAHNTFQSSTPADGSVVVDPPVQISMIFTDPVPLETATAEVIEASGVRTDLTGLTHGPLGATEVVAALPSLTPGEITVRWRLVGPDGHPLTGRVRFTISAAAVDPASTPPATTSSPPDSSSPAALGAGTSEPTIDVVDDDFSTPRVVRWLLRYGSYLAIMIVVGVVLTDALVWPGSAARPRLRRTIDRSLAVIALFAVAQALVLAADVSGAPPWRSLGSLDVASQTDAGLALLLRSFIAGAAWLVLRRADIRQTDVRWTAIGVTGVALLATWAFAGHAASRRWPYVGVPVDVVHHVAAATWLGALAIVGVVAVRDATPQELPGIVQRLSRTAAIAVVIVSLTGVVQSVRLIDLADLFDASHGRLLLAKLAALALMLAAANRNRRRVMDLARRHDRADDRAMSGIRRTIGVEVVLGLVILAITSAMVVSPPA